MALLCVLFLTHTMRSGAPRRSQVYQTAAGHRAKVQLAGGSTMLLGPSTLAIVTGSDVTVTGEAYFNIAPKSARAVTVTTANVIVQVLGTAFVVRQYPGEMHATVAVDNGKIGVRTRTDSTERSTPTVVTARMVATVTDQQVTIAHDASAREYTGWVSGVLVFRHAALQDVVAEVGRAYGSEIRIADSALARRTISVELDIAQSSLTQVLDIVGLTLHAHYQRDGGTYVLASGRKDNSKEEKQRGIHIFDSERHYGR
jgi:transmembrane sensor